jgi:hypothetical protein
MPSYRNATPNQAFQGTPVNTGVMPRMSQPNEQYAYFTVTSSFDLKVIMHVSLRI